MDKYALLNILLAFTTGILAIVSATQHKDVDLKPYEKKKVYLAKSIAIYIGITACLICLFSEEQAGEHMMLANKWTIVLTLALIGELLTGYFVNKKCHPREWETPDEKSE